MEQIYGFPEYLSLFMLSQFLGNIAPLKGRWMPLIKLKSVLVTLHYWIATEQQLRKVLLT